MVSISKEAYQALMYDATKKELTKTHSKEDVADMARIYRRWREQRGRRKGTCAIKRADYQIAFLRAHGLMGKAVKIEKDRRVAYRTCVRASMRGKKCKHDHHAKSGCYHCPNTPECHSIGCFLRRGAVTVAKVENF